MDTTRVSLADSIFQSAVQQLIRQRDTPPEPEPKRYILIVVNSDGSISPYFGGHPGPTYQSWKHFFACGISEFADGDMLRIWGA